MKKAKIMLMSIAVLATVGSALAFKVNKLGSTTYCYLETETEPAVGECTNIIERKKAEPTGLNKYYYTELTAPSCSQLSCPKSARSFID